MIANKVKLYGGQRRAPPNIPRTQNLARRAHAIAFRVGKIAIDAAHACSCTQAILPTLQRRRDSMSPERTDKILRPTNGESELELRARDRTCDLRFTKALLYR